MKYWYQPPPKSIAGYIRTILVLNGADSLQPSELPLFANGLPALLTEISKEGTRLTLYGQSIAEDRWAIDDDTILIAHFFRPFAIGSVFGVAAKELQAGAVELADWHAAKSAGISHQLTGAGSTTEQLEILEHFLAAQIQEQQKDCHIIKYATDQMMYEPDKDVHARILAELQLTERTFQRIFKKYTGITPNQYRRICQFYFAFSQLKSGKFDKLTDVAYTHGYFDQSHYIRSFKEFTNTTPNEYLNTGLAKNDG